MQSIHFTQDTLGPTFSDPTRSRLDPGSRSELDSASLDPARCKSKPEPHKPPDIWPDPDMDPMLIIN